MASAVAAALAAWTTNGSSSIVKQWEKPTRQSISNSKIGDGQLRNIHDEILDQNGGEYTVAKDGFSKTCGYTRRLRDFIGATHRFCTQITQLYDGLSEARD